MDWFLARVKSRILETAEQLGAYYPVVERVTKPKNKHRPVISQVPILPRMLVVDLEQYHEALSLPNVRGSVKINQRLLILRENDLERLRQIEEENRVELPLADRPEPEIIFKDGDKIKVVKGCFAEQLGVVTRRIDRFSYEVLIDQANMPIIFNSCLLAHR